jgi:hypothetical protein
MELSVSSFEDRPSLVFSEIWTIDLVRRWQRIDIPPTQITRDDPLKKVSKAARGFGQQQLALTI